MPSWVTHLVTANKILERLQTKDIKENEKGEFVFGNIMPDIFNGFNITVTNRLSYYTTHFAKKVQINGIDLPIPDIDRFKQEYKSEIANNPVICGFYTHLLTDYFWNEYSYKNYFEIYDKEQRIVKLRYKDGKQEILTWAEAVREKQKDFALFAQFLRGKLGKQILMDANEILLCSQDIKEFKFTKEEIEKTIEYLNDIKEGVIANTEYKIFTQSEFEQKLEESIEFIMENLACVNI